MDDGEKDSRRPNRLPATRVDADGWNALHPHWRDRLDSSSALALTVEALRRAIELRDLLAEADSPETIRALMLVDVLNPLYELTVAQRAGEGGAPAPHGTGADIVRALDQSGLLPRSEYRSAP